MICFIEVLGAKTLGSKPIKHTININEIVRFAPYGDESKAMILIKEDDALHFRSPVYTEHTYDQLQQILVSFRSVEMKVLA